MLFNLYVQLWSYYSLPLFFSLLGLQTNLFQGHILDFIEKSEIYIALNDHSSLPFSVVNNLKLMASPSLPPMSAVLFLFAFLD